MVDIERKYSIWLRPSGKTKEVLQQFIQQLADELKTPPFEPHLTLVGSVYVSDAKLKEAEQQLDTLASQTKQFSISLATYGFLSETYRCLFITADSPQLTALYEQLSGIFPQVQTEHFQSLAHVSILYGQFDEGVKKSIIKTHPILPLQFEVTALDFFFTGGPETLWRHVYSSKLIS